MQHITREHVVFTKICTCTIIVLILKLHVFKSFLYSDEIGLLNIQLLCLYLHLLLFANKENKLIKINCTSKQYCQVV